MSIKNKSITILGSTGSIGRNTLNVIKESGGFDVIALVAGADAATLAAQAREFGAKYAVISDESKYSELKSLLDGSQTQAMAGFDAIMEVAGIKVDITMSAIVGDAGLAPTMRAIENGARIALANKECLVCAGDIMMEAVKNAGAELIPVDSEHSAIFQVLEINNTDRLKKIVLTASGGPFKDFSLSQMQQVTPEQAVRHPKWNMGRKISVDSATMMNKGLEIIEAYYLFPVKKEQIDVVVHPESVIHSMVEYTDGSTLAQLGTPDMRTPISIAMNWPKRGALIGQGLSLTQIGKLTFEPVDNKRFPAVNIARTALNDGGFAPAVMNSANEVAVDAFLKGKIGFLQIAEIVGEAVASASFSAPSSIDDILNIISVTRSKVSKILNKAA